ncbi:MAG TPA: DUF222 domain-containing protein [Streptosporangiaceae bacterium]|nr:DUF222 domain-containing protein [Streptosporangiaceae bacterium]
MATDEDRGRVLSIAELSGHAIMAPGPDLACWLACGQAPDRDDAALVNSITAWRKVTSWAQAQELAAVAELARRRRVTGAVDTGAADRDPAADAGQEDDDPVAELEAEFAPNEVALALTLTQGGAETWMDLAVSLTRRLPATLAALSEGAIDLNRARLIDQFTSSLDADLAQAVERRVLVRAEHQTSGQLRASLQRAVLAADPAAAERRREETEKRAWVALFGDHDGTASLSGRFLPAAQAAAAWARICAMAKAMESAGAGGGMDLLRAQVFVGLLLGTLPLIPATDGAPDGRPGDDGCNDEGPDDEGPDDEGPDDEGLEDDGPDDEGPDDGNRGGDGWGGGPSGPGDASSAGNGPWGDAGTPRDEDAPHDTDCDDGRPDALGSDDGGPEGRDRESDSSEGEPSADEPGTGRPLPLPPPPPPPAWPPLPLPGAIPAPGCARPGPARASLADSQDRRGPPGTSPTSSTLVPPSAGNSYLAGRAVLSVPWRTLAGWSHEPGELGRIGPITAGVARDLAWAAAADVTCEWKVIVVDRAGAAVAVAKIRRVRAGTRGGSGSAGGTTAAGSGRAGTGPGVVGRLTVTMPVDLLDVAAWPTTRKLADSGELGNDLVAALTAGAKAFSARPAQTRQAACVHEEASPSYQVPDSMRALVEARDQTCGFPVCRQPAWRCEQDHTIAYRLGGPTCPCNLSPECPRHHHLKHLPSWRLDQPLPGILTWTTPARLTHTVTSGPYPA